MKKQKHTECKKWKMPVLLIASLFVWLGIWQLAAQKMQEPIFLPYPKDVFCCLISLLGTRETYRILWGSLRHICVGFCAAFAVGTVLAAGSSAMDWFAALVRPAIKLIKTVPVVSFIILLLLWVDSEKLGIVTAMLIALPVFYENARQGIRETDRDLREMAELYRIPRLQQVWYIYVPAVLPYLAAATKVALSLCFKAGIAAEIIGLCKDSIGRQLYDAKLYLDTEALFAWTGILVCISLLAEGCLIIAGRLLRCGRGRRMEELPETSLEVPPPKCMVQAKEMITLTKVTKIYDGKTVLLDVSLQLEPGSCTVITGPSGCGKTTLLNLLAGTRQPDCGSCILPEDIRIAPVTQEPALIPGISGEKNVRLACSPVYQREDIVKCLRATGIPKPERTAVRDYSGGMKQRVAMWRAFLSEAELLLLDEPFRGLDANRKEQMLACLETYGKSRTIVIVTHNASEIREIYKRFPNCQQIHLEEN